MFWIKYRDPEGEQTVDVDSIPAAVKLLLSFDKGDVTVLSFKAGDECFLSELKTAWEDATYNLAEEIMRESGEELPRAEGDRDCAISDFAFRRYGMPFEESNNA